MENKEYTWEQINEYRAKLYEELIKLGEPEWSAKGICAFDDMIIAGTINIPEHKATKDEAISVWRQIMQYNTPRQYAELMTM